MSAVKLLTVSEDEGEMRLDRWFKRRFPHVTQGAVEKLCRTGQVRVDGARAKASDRVGPGMVVRVPPLPENDAPSRPRPDGVSAADAKMIQDCVIYRDNDIIVLNKPAGMAVHGGSGLSFGVIEGLRALRPEARFLELVHRLDRDTSGCLLIAKKRSALKNLHEQLRLKTMRKQYCALVRGQWQPHVKVVNAPLLKNVLQSGERIVRVNPEGKPSETRFHILQRFAEATLVEASPITGRTHQIRVHTAHAGHPIACDDKYGDATFDSKMREQGLGRLFLHAMRLTFRHPVEQRELTLEAPLDPHLQAVLKKLAVNP